MPSSLGSLSSPSPSPPPSQTRQDTRASTSNNSGAGAGLDSDSELSELTEDEQENTNSKADREERARPSRRGRKRGGIVPAPMWDWAYKNKKDWKSKMLEEEEEDDQSMPTKTVDEEEDDEEGSRSQSGASLSNERQRKRKSGTALLVDDNDDDDEPGPGSEIEDEASVDAVSVAQIADDALNDPDYVSEDEDARLAVVAVARDVRRSGTREASPEATDDENAEADDVEPGPDADPQDDEDVVEGAPAEESEDDGEEGAEDTHSLPVPSAALDPPVDSATSSAAADDVADPDTTLAPMDVDVPVTVPPQVSPIIAAAAASSIMAGSLLVARPSPSPSTSSAASGSARNQSPASSRSPSPEPVSDREPDNKRGSAKIRAKIRLGRLARNRSRRKTKTDLALEHEAEQDQPQGDVDDRDADVDDVDVDSPEMDIELDLQPAHRAEALDVLATIELKYALLRESLYVEKMEALAWEEALVAEGIHPEMSHLHAELSKRRDKRLELATLRRDYEIANVTKRRKLDEDGVWSWWKLRRDELQTQMISETNRKRRKLDRERRAIDRPQPVRRVPSPPQNIPLAPSLREVIKHSPLDAAEYKKHQLPESALAYPQLSTLSTPDIMNDLEFLAAHRRTLHGFDQARVGAVGHPMVTGPVPGPPFDQFGPGIGIGMPEVPGPPSRFTQMPYQSIPQAVPGPMVQGYVDLAAPRLQHHHAAPGTHTQMIVEQEAGPMNRSGAPSSSSAPSGSHVASYLAPIPASMTRRSISPLPAQHSTNGSSIAVLPVQTSTSKSNSRSGFNIPGLSSSSLKDHRRITSGGRILEADGYDRERGRYLDGLKPRDKDDRPRDMLDRDRDHQYDRERVKERERDRESDRELDRPSHVPLALQRMPSHPHTHQHLHPSNNSQGSIPHHHHYHHHHVHHHHHPNSANGSNPNAAGQVANVTALHPSNGLASRNPSPLPGREADRRAYPGAPSEVVDLSSSKLVPSGSTPGWRSNDEQAAMGDIHNRARLNVGPSPRERAMPPSYPSSPRTGPMTAPTSLAPSRRGSWSAPDDSVLPRPSSSASGHLPSTGPQRLPAAVASSPRTQVPPSLPTQRSPSMLSPTRHNAIRLPPLSPSLGSGARSPVRTAQPLPGQSLPPIPSPSKSTSPKLFRRTPPPSARAKTPSRDIHTPLGSGPPTILASQKVAPSSPPTSLFPTLSHTSLSNQRLPNIGVGSETKLAPPKVNAVPID